MGISIKEHKLAFLNLLLVQFSIQAAGNFVDLALTTLHSVFYESPLYLSTCCCLRSAELRGEKNVMKIVAKNNDLVKEPAVDCCKVGDVLDFQEKKIFVQLSATLQINTASLPI